MNGGRHYRTRPTSVRKTGPAWREYDRFMAGPVQSIERAAAILRLLAGGPRRLGLGEVAASLGLAKGTAHGLLRTLQHVDFVEQDPATGKYQLGAALLHLGTSYLDVNELRSRSINWADALAARSGEAVRLGTPLEGKVLVVHHVFRPDDTLQTLDVGSLLPLHASSLGKILLAFGTTPIEPALEAGLEAYTRHTLVVPEELTRALAEIQELGWAGEVQEMSMGDAGVAAPIRGQGGLAVGAIGVSGPVERICDSQGRPRPTLITLLREAARAISRDLGAARW